MHTHPHPLPLHPLTLWSVGADGLTCLFGEAPATSTVVWSSTTIVCTLPAAAAPGPAVVRFREYPQQGVASSTDPMVLFNYVDGMPLLARVSLSLSLGPACVDSPRGNAA